MRVILKELDPAETYPQYVRWNDDCECVQITFDGTTWVDSPDSDPRYGPGFRAPALTGDAKCDAAARMVAVIRAQVDAALDAAEAVALATSLLSIVTAFLPGINIIVTVFVAVANAVLVFGAAALAADFTEENYDKLTCIFYDNIDTNGQVSAAQLDDILADIEAEFGISVIYPVCQLLFDTMGENGFSNAGSLGTGTGDCEDCEPKWCYEFDYTSSAYTVTAVPGYTGVLWSSGQGLYNSGVYGYSQQLFGVEVSGVYRIEVDMTLSGSVNAGNGLIAMTDGSNFSLIGAETSNGTIIYEDGPYGGAGFRFNPTNQYSGGVIYFARVRLYGTGENPFGTDTCTPD